jgi:hypothetical protein
MDDLRHWVGKKVRLCESLRVLVMVGRALARELDDDGCRHPMRVTIAKEEVFRVVGFYKGRLDLLYQPKQLSEKVLLHVPPLLLEKSINGHALK